MNKRRSEKRLTLMLFGVGLLLISFILVSVYLVKARGIQSSYTTLNQAAGSRSVILAQPGSIVDANGTYLAVTKSIYRVIIDPKVMNETEEDYPGSLEKTCDLAYSVLSLPKEDLYRAFVTDPKKTYIRFNGNTFISEADVNAWNAAVKAYQTEKDAYNKKPENKRHKMTARIAGIWFEKEYRREYPLNTVLSKVVGYTTPDAKEGITGLEKYYDDVLRGTDGASYVYIDEDGYSVSNVQDAVNGCTLITSLDANVTRIIQDRIRDFQEEIGGHRINVVVMNPQNGEIISMASDTDFDLNNPSDISSLFTEEELEHPEESFLLTEAFKNRESQLEQMSREELLTSLRQQVQLNYAVSGTFEPGSTSKALTLAACIEENVFSKDYVYRCDHVIPVANYNIHCHQEVACGDLIPIEAFGRSCNVCFVHYGLELGAALLAKYQELFNLGQKTNIDLPGEANTANLIYQEKNLHDIEIATNAFGQGYTLTMVQMAAAYSSLVNGGFYYEPHVVTQIRDLSGNVVRDIEPVLVRRTISKETSEYMKEAFRYVVTFGTATPSLTEGYPMAGKTGASEKLPRGTGKYVVSFISMVPIEDPRYLIYVAVDEPYVDDQSMSAPAQKLARSIWESLYDYWNIYPESDEDAYTYDWSRLKDFSDLSDAQDPSGIITPETAPAPEESTTAPALEESPAEDIPGQENTQLPTDIPAEG